MKNLRLLAFMLAAGVVFTACKDDDDAGSNNNTPAQTKTQMLTAKNYKMTDFGFEVGGQYASAFNDTSFVSACEKDDLTKFNTNGTWATTDAGVACSPTSAESGTWAFMNNETQMRLISGTGTDADTTMFNILTLNATTLKMSAPSLIGNVVVTHTAQ